mgnify:CR=1 FL=1
MLGLNPWVILGVFLAIAAAGAAGYGKGHSDGVDSTTLAYETSLEKQRAKTQEIILASKDDVIAAERAFNEFKDQVEKDNVEKNQKLEGLRLANGRLIDATCGLYDKNGRPRGGSGEDGLPSDPGAARSAQGRPAACNLPTEVRELVRRFGVGLRDILFEADQSAVYAQTGHAYAVGLPRTP